MSPGGLSCGSLGRRLAKSNGNWAEGFGLWGLRIKARVQSLDFMGLRDCV